MVLCERTNNGIEVELVKTEESLYVYVADGDTKFRLEAASGKEALDMFEHPFFYYGKDLRTQNIS
jgi:hypothetical protein